MDVVVAIFAKALRNAGALHRLKLLVEGNVGEVLRFAHTAGNECSLGGSDYVYLEEVKGFFCVLIHLAGLSSDSDDFTLLNEARELGSEVGNFDKFPSTIVAERRFVLSVNFT